MDNDNRVEREAAAVDNSVFVENEKDGIKEKLQLPSRPPASPESCQESMLPNSSEKEEM